VQYREAFFDSQSSHLCIVMELASKGDLAKLIQTRFKNAEGFFEYEIWKYGVQILAGLKHLHSTNIVHRDLKPANIFFGPKDEVKIGDLNVSKKLNGLALTQTGTPNYASPEIWNNDPYSFDCDVWSFGCIMYELCCFKPPFRSRSMDELFKKVQNGAYDRIPKRYSFMLEDTIALCLQKRDKRAKVDQLI
jgi:NIMA (never in mitosis gene a)-related kinase 1/4/5